MRTLHLSTHWKFRCLKRPRWTYLFNTLSVNSDPAPVRGGNSGAGRNGYLQSEVNLGNRPVWGCCLLRYEVKNIKGKWQLRCKKVCPGRMSHMIQKRHRQYYILELGDISNTIHVPCHLSLPSILQTGLPYAGEPLCFNALRKGGSITGCEPVQSFSCSHFQETLQLRTTGNRRNR